MAYDLEEQEQLATLKAWWARWGNLVLGVITLVLLAIAGWNGWNWYQREQAAKAGALYAELEKAAGMNNTNVVKDSTKILLERFGRTVYAPLAAFHAARLNHEANELTAAQENLQWVIDKSGRPEFVAIARHRLAAVLLDAKQYDAALKLVEGDIPAEHVVAYADRRGDILFAQGKVDDARAAWQKALDSADLQSPLRGLIQFKLDALPPVEKS